jgi:hypothetical protein
VAEVAAIDGRDPALEALADDASTHVGDSGRP